VTVTVPDAVPAEDFRPVPKRTEMAFDLRTGGAVQEHCMCLTWTHPEGTVYEVCCECWYGRKEGFMVRSRRQPRRTKR
jgi:hypothetical protein